MATVSNAIKLIATSRREMPSQKKGLFTDGRYSSSAELGATFVAVLSLLLPLLLAPLISSG